MEVNRRVFQVSKFLACVASIIMGLRSKERPRNKIFYVLPALKMGRELPKQGKRGKEEEGKEGNVCRQTLGFENPVRLRNGLLIG